MRVGGARRARSGIDIRKLSGCCAAEEDPRRRELSDDGALAHVTAPRRRRRDANNAVLLARALRPRLSERQVRVFSLMLRRRAEAMCINTAEMIVSNHKQINHHSEYKQPQRKPRAVFF